MCPCILLRFLSLSAPAVVLCAKRACPRARYAIGDLSGATVRVRAHYTNARALAFLRYLYGTVR